MNNISLEEICEVLFSNDNFILAIHKNPDGDAIGSSLALYFALKKLKKKCKIVCNDPFPKDFVFLLDKEDINFFSFNVMDKSFIITVDVASTELLGEYLGEIKERVDLSIDHHPTLAYFAKKFFTDTKASATAEIIYKIIKKLGVLDKTIGECIYVGILTDTGFFKNPNVTFETHRIVYKLIKLGIRNNFVMKNLSKPKTIEQVRLYHSVLGTLELFLNGKCAISYVTKEMIKKFGLTKEDSSGFTNISRSILGVIIGVFLREEEKNSYKVSIRTEGDIDASKICASFGGGGHLNAAGCVIDGSFDEVKAKILNEISKQREIKN